MKAKFKAGDVLRRKGTTCMKHDWTRAWTRDEVVRLTDEEVDVYADHLEHSVAMINHGGTTIEKVVHEYALYSCVSKSGTQVYVVPRWGWGIIFEDNKWNLYY